MARLLLVDPRPAGSAGNAVLVITAHVSDVAAWSGRRTSAGVLRSTSLSAEPWVQLIIMHIAGPPLPLALQPHAPEADPHLMICRHAREQA